MLFSVETQTTEERTQQYQSEIESIYKDLTVKGKALMLSTELGVRFPNTSFSSQTQPILAKLQTNMQSSNCEEFGGDIPQNRHVTIIFRCSLS